MVLHLDLDGHLNISALPIEVRYLSAGPFHVNHALKMSQTDK